eukprot:CAMPEP_0185733146 /NCGR_PEP_ID=MMETSP1171-20130828/18534_1 /TAXON_ID=374046 /ORGANISM="Helicotheca tamensis, Strain CCMP826" /LENGTH=568 /DNA_ID=CAMNT_0028402783 /DNA_START=28 /DNA_END=1734 /DNA_ORIENTATION=+
MKRQLSREDTLQNVMGLIGTDENEKKWKIPPFLLSIKNVIVKHQMVIAIYCLGSMALLFLLSGMSASSNYGTRGSLSKEDMLVGDASLQYNSGGADGQQSGLGNAVDGFWDVYGMASNAAAQDSENAYLGPAYDMYNDPTYMSANAVEEDANFDGEVGDKIVRSIDDLRFLTLGAMTAMTDGVSQWTSSYPYLLSSDPEKISNIAIGSVGPRYPSVCIQSLVAEAAGPDGNQEFDVIVLDYHVRAKEGLYDLAKRLRMRYPDAIMILLRNWRPVHVTWFMNGKSQGSIQNWATTNNHEFGTQSFFQELRKVDVRWQSHEERDQVYRHIQRDFNAKVSRFPQPSDAGFALQKYGELFDTDMNHLNKAGHEFVHKGIDTIINAELGIYPEQPRVGSWGDGDSCHSWFSDGKVPLERSSNTVIEEFSAAQVEFALSTGADNPDGSGWVTVNNPFNGPRNLILSYMVTGPPAIYPKTQIHVLTGGYENTSSVHRSTINTVDPLTTEYGDTPVHNVVTAKVAILPPGDSKVVWKPVEESSRPFRLTATQVVGLTVEEGGILGPHPDFIYLDSY